MKTRNQHLDASIFRYARRAVLMAKELRWPLDSPYLDYALKSDFTGIMIRMGEIARDVSIDTRLSRNARRQYSRLAQIARKHEI